MKKISTAVLPALLCALSCGLLAGCGADPEPVATPMAVRPVKMMVIEAPADARTRSMPGKVRAGHQTDLAFPLPGRIVELPVREGQMVKEGELIARLDDEDYALGLKAQEAQLAKARADLDRVGALYEQHAVSRSDYDAARTAYAVYESTMERSRKALNDTVLRAPFSGRVARVHTENYTNVQPMQRVVSLQDTGHIEIVIHVPEILVNMANKDAEVMITATFEGHPDRHFPLTIREFGTDADPVTRTYPLTLAMDAPKDINVLPGMSTTVFCTMPAEISGGFAVPLGAVFAGPDDGSAVWVVDAEMKVHRTLVQTGGVGGGNISLMGGVRPGERVVTAGVHSLSEGLEVRPYTRPGK